MKRGRRGIGGRKTKTTLNSIPQLKDQKRNSKQKQQELDVSYPLTRSKSKMKKSNPKNVKKSKTSVSSTAKKEELKDESKYPELEEAMARHKSAKIEKEKEVISSPRKQTAVTKNLVVADVSKYVAQNIGGKVESPSGKEKKLEIFHNMLRTGAFDKLDTDNRKAAIGLLAQAAGGESFVKQVNASSKQYVKMMSKEDKVPSKKLFEDEVDEEEEYIDSDDEKDQSKSDLKGVFETVPDTTESVLVENKIEEAAEILATAEFAGMEVVTKINDQVVSKDEFAEFIEEETKRDAELLAMFYEQEHLRKESLQPNLDDHLTIKQHWQKFKEEQKN